MIGNMLRDREVQYVAAKDELTNTWRILDTWHDDLKVLQPEDEIPDDSPAVKILTDLPEGIRHICCRTVFLRRRIITNSLDFPT